MPESGQKQILLSKIQTGQAVIGIIGLGYVGLPLALAFAEKGFRVLGFDVDIKKIEALDRGDCYISHMDPVRVTRAVQTKQIVATADFSRLGEPDTLLICVPTPLTPQRDPDMSYIINTTEQIQSRLRVGQLIVLESTT